MLAVSETGNSAVKPAARADFVLVSMYRKAQLSAQIRDWIERWLGLLIDNKARAGRAARSTWNEAWHGRIHTGVSTQRSRPERD